MRPLGDFLADKGYTVLGVRLAGHATHPGDLAHTRWTDWLDNVADGLALLSSHCSQRILIGQSLGGMISLLAAARYQPHVAVAISTPYGTPPRPSWRDRLRIVLHQTIYKEVELFPPGHPLVHRRELNYPAYPEFPAQIFSQLEQIILAMMETLSQVHIPTLLVNSRDDPVVPFVCQQAIYDRLGSSQKDRIAFDGIGHSMVMDPLRQLVFEAVQGFLSRVIDDA
jgi:carboxylesterase